jgi:hypothetical protein
MPDPNKPQKRPRRNKDQPPQGIILQDQSQQRNGRNPKTNNGHNQ